MQHINNDRNSSTLQSQSLCRAHGYRVGKVTTTNNNETFYLKEKNNNNNSNNNHEPHKSRQVRKVLHVFIVHTTLFD